MHGAEELPLVRDTTPMREVLITMTAKRFGCAGRDQQRGRNARYSDGW